MPEFCLTKCEDAAAAADYASAYNVTRVEDNVVVGELVKEQLPMRGTRRTHNYSWEFYPNDDYYTEYAPRHYDNYRHAKGSIEEGGIKRMKL